ncbi:MAG: TetR/AcrR family transcriptional regulator [Panacagrimonas sp.]
MPDAVSTVRDQNMQRRRARLLAEARGLLARGGYEALSLRELARLADVTVPTIYNLIGNKDEVLLALGADVLAEVETRIRSVRSTDPLVLAAATVEESTRLFTEDENLYRSAFLAIEWLDQRPLHHAEAARIHAWAGAVFATGFEACRKAMLLRGRIPLAVLGQMMMRSFRTSCRAWAFGLCDLEEFRRVALLDVYITLAADAGEDFHRLLIRKISGLARQVPALKKETKEVPRKRSA